MKSSKGKGPANGPAKTPKKLQASSSGRINKQKDPVEVYCRIRPLREDESESCAETISKTVLQLKPPECSLAFRAGHCNTTMHTFKTVFGPECTQTSIFDRVGIPLVEDLLAGKNGLLFAYGITNSGKTFTVNGEPEQAGILPRSLDVIFNSIIDVQTAKYVFRSNGSNSYDIFSEEEAIVEQKRNRPKKISPRMRAEQPDYGDLLRIPEPRKIDHVVDEDSGYAVFVSYIEIYNNYVYDLLEEDSPTHCVKQKPPTSRLLREDSTHNMYVSGAVEIEVKSTEEAFEVLCRGQRKRRVGLTQLNQESSRSHSVFTIRLVQAPLDHSGRDVLLDNSKVHVSQMSLVDLAGSERTSRTQTSGERLKEASSINKALLVLRTCMETLRDNQVNSTTRIVPYRDTKLTHLFKNYFDGEGKVRMVVCVSPREEDYDETIHVMRFAEVTQEVVVDRPQTRRLNSGLAPGRKRAYLLYKAALKQAAAEKNLGDVATDFGASADGDGSAGGGGGGVKSPLVGVPHPYLLALGVLSIQKYLSEDCTALSLSEFKAALEERALVRNKLIEDIKKKQSSFHTSLVAAEKEVEELRKTVSDLKQQGKVKDKMTNEVKRLKGIITAQDEKMVQLTAELEKATRSRLTAERESLALNEKLSRVSQQKQYLMKTTEMYEADKRELEQELTAERVALQRTAKETRSVRSTMQGFVSAEKEKFEKLASKMKNREKDLAIKSEKLRQVEELIKNSPCTIARSRDPLGVVNKGSQSSEETNTPRAETGTSTETGAGPAIPLRGKAGRKRSSSENWLEHKPSSNVVSGDLLQPVLKKKKTVTTPKPRHLKSNVRNRYCLEHQEEDSEGDVKTALYKGEILKTRGGGRSIQFTDVEILKHNRPISKVKERPRPPTPRTRPRRSQRRTVLGKENPLNQGVSLRGASAATTNKATNESDSSSSTSFLSSSESSMDEMWTDVETRCAVAIEGRPGGAQPALAHMSPSKPHREK